MSPVGLPALSKSDLLSVLVSAGATFVRIHQLKDGPLWFGPALGKRPTYRFDAPAGEYRTLYAAERLEGAFAETVLRRARRIVARDYVEARQWSVISCSRDLKLVKLFDEGLLRHGVTADICAGDDYGLSQAFANLLHNQYAEVDGIAYRARHNNGEKCYALFDRVLEASLTVVDNRRFGNERVLTDDLMRMYNASWDPKLALPPL